MEALNAAPETQFSETFTLNLDIAGLDAFACALDWSLSCGRVQRGHLGFSFFNIELGLQWDKE